MSSLSDFLRPLKASIVDREKVSQYIQSKPSEFDVLLKLACSRKNERINLIAAWSFEYYSLNRLDELTPYIDQILAGSVKQNDERKRRPFAKLIYHYCKSKKRKDKLSKGQIDIIITHCFNQLIEAEKIATIGFALKTIQFFRNHEEWIADEIDAYIEKTLSERGTSFHALVRQIS